MRKVQSLAPIWFLWVSVCILSMPQSILLADAAKKVENHDMDQGNAMPVQADEMETAENPKPDAKEDLLVDLKARLAQLPDAAAYRFALEITKSMNLSPEAFNAIIDKLPPLDGDPQKDQILREGLKESFNKQAAALGPQAKQAVAKAALDVLGQKIVGRDPNLQGVLDKPDPNAEAKKLIDEMLKKLADLQKGQPAMAKNEMDKNGMKNDDLLAQLLLDRLLNKDNQNDMPMDKPNPKEPPMAMLGGGGGGDNSPAPKPDSGGQKNPPSRSGGSMPKSSPGNSSSNTAAKKADEKPAEPYQPPPPIKPETQTADTSPKKKKLPAFSPQVPFPKMQNMGRGFPLPGLSRNANNGAGNSLSRSMSPMMGGFGGGGFGGSQGLNAGAGSFPYQVSGAPYGMMMPGGDSKFQIALPGGYGSSGSSEPDTQASDNSAESSSSSASKAFSGTINVDSRALSHENAPAFEPAVQQALSALCASDALQCSGRSAR